MKWKVRWIMDKDEVCFECRREYGLEGDNPPCDKCNLEYDELDEFDDDYLDMNEPEPFFIAIPRTNPMFLRPMEIITPSSHTIIPRTDSDIVCDVCNEQIGSDFINCATFNDGYSIWGAYCDDCRKEYQDGYPTLSLDEARERMINKELIP